MCPVTDLNAVEKNVPILSVEHLKKNFGEHEVLRDITFDVPQGDVVSIIGSSGSGASSGMPDGLNSGSRIGWPLSAASFTFLLKPARLRTPTADISL